MWSCSSQDVLSLSAFFVLSFCRNNDLLQLFRHAQLPTVKPCSLSYVNKVKGELESMGCRIKTSCRVKSVSSLDGSRGFRVLEKDGSEETYDSVILGVHAPNALKVLGVEATHHERRILGACQYVHRDIYLHCDQNLMPLSSSAWSAWNFLGTTSRGFSVTYWLNQIQKIESVRPFLVTLNPPCVPEHVLLKWNTSLPVPSILHPSVLERAASSHHPCPDPPLAIDMNRVAAGGLFLAYLPSSCTSGRRPVVAMNGSTTPACQLQPRRELQKIRNGSGLGSQSL